MTFLLKLGDSFLRLVEYDANTFYSQYPLTEHSNLVSGWGEPAQPSDDTPFHSYHTEMKDLLMQCPSMSILNPYQVANEKVQVPPFQQQNDIARMRDYEVILCYQLIQNWPESVIMDSIYEWPVDLEVKECDS